jgi:UDP-glucose 4-epimerase
MKWLVTGGAGFIGGHVVHALLSRGYEAIVLDDFSTGRPAFVPAGVSVVEGTLLAPAVFARALAEPGITGVIHIAGYKFAGESVKFPIHTYEQNVVGTMNLLAGMENSGIPRIIFSSSSAVYGDANVDVISEGHPRKPKSPYGESKLIGEWLLQNLGVSRGFQHSSLRYFNVVGSSQPGIFDTSPHSLFSLVFEAISQGKAPKIFGFDYPTRDGTCVRDYIPVGALAEAHVVAAERLVAGEPLELAYNLGTGTGHSVAEVMTMIAEVTGIALEPERAPRRPGDPATVVASGELAARDLGWDPQTDLSEMVRQAWSAFLQAKEEQS